MNSDWNWNTFGAFVYGGWALLYVIIPLGFAIYMRIKYKKKIGKTLDLIGEEMMKNDV
jgi:hypothetical protein